MSHQTKNSYGIISISLVVLVLIILFSGLYFLTRRINPESSFILPNLANTLTGQTPAPTPFLFQEMTVPYLRSRTFDSNLTELTKLSENASYTSYLTSYDSDGLKVNGLLTIPKGEAPSEGWPAIVFVHGYIAPTIYRTQSNYVSYVDNFARSGFVVFKIDLRGHDKSEGEAGGGYYSGDYVIDTLSAYSALENADFVDSGAIGLWGHSMAGNVLMRSFVSKPNIPAVVIWGGAGYTYRDLLTYRISDNSYRPPQQNTERQRKRQLLREAYGDFNEDSEFWKQVTPLNYLSDIKGAIQIHHAVDDNVVSIEYGRNLMDILEGSTFPHELVEYQTGGHNITGSSFTRAMQVSVEFFKTYLK